jgi:hypothetical protein
MICVVVGPLSTLTRYVSGFGSRVLLALVTRSRG